MELTELVSQLEQAKFARLLRYLLDLPWPEGQHDRISTPAVPVDIADSQLLVKLVGKMSADETYLGSWAFQLVHLPAGLCSTPAWRQILLDHLERGIRALAKHPDPLGALLGGSVVHPYKMLAGPAEGCDYHLFTNMACEPAEFIRDFHEHASMMFGTIIPDAHWHPRFGLGTAETIAGYARPETETFVKGLLRTPSGYQFVAREGQITIVPYVDHGSFLARGQSLLGTSTFCTASSVVPIPDLDFAAVAQLEALLDDPRVQEDDLQRLFEEQPQLLRAINPHYRELIPHVCLSDDRGNRLVPDFLVRVEGGLWDLLELKHPRAPLTRKLGGKLSPAAKTASGISQLLRYRDFFTIQENRERLAKRYGIAPLEPQLVLVAGRSDPPMLAQWHTTVDGYPGATLVSYDYVLERARLCAAAVEQP